VFAALVLRGIGFAQARDDGGYANSSLKPWFESLHNKNGAQCCADADGITLADVDWDSDNGRYRVVSLDGQWIVVPDDRGITEPKRVGHAIGLAAIPQR
jgi:hypothetical protein